ncbi:MAG: hypothetical protein ACYDAE_19860 [Steroidobacteraceae bacterium]
MDKRDFLHTTVTADIKRRIKAAAAAEFVTPTAWLRRVAIRALPPQPLDLVRGEPEEAPGGRENRLYVRLGAEDSLLLKTRALARGMRPATYIGVLVRSHLRSLRPLPKDELLALRCAVSELGALTRELHRIAHVLGHDGQAASPDQPDLPAVLRLCQALRSDTKALIRANVNSWEIGRPSSASASRQPVRL